ncbi:integrin alpha-PS2-like [Panonychus citri]|uniref:integrin alpha-PS2-like n=1 Tax=Panonychus citri TaxID=50023 RepID=UPI002307E41F|nr:integrin alpha-PS2-like [Panonychus citri]XP_053210256.1 integrin alpha-PS2-like [Panonychus citri]
MNNKKMLQLFGKLISSLVVLIVLDLSESFNIDTDYPIILQPQLKSETINIDFGASVVIHQNKYSRILIGAPKANSIRSPSKRIGAVFDCQLIVNNSKAQCTQIDEPTDSIANMHLGSSLASKSKSSSAIACSHLKTKSVQTNSDYPNGACYTIKLAEQSEAKYDKIMIPFENLAQISGNFYYFSHGMFGFSTLFIEDYNRWIIGAPGFSGWRGAIVVYNKLEDSSSIRINHIDSPSDSYFGYSLATGHFFRDKKLYVASGAPRDGHTGLVCYFKFDNLQFGSSKSSSSIPGVQRLRGIDTGEYFGYSVLIVDINGDSFDDLIVGAPLYSPNNHRRGDIGRCYIYLSNGETFANPVFKYGDSNPKSRFGSSMAQLGDINFDGYKDVVIGAPFEDECGAIYIYHGSRSGLTEKYSQKISACDPNNKLKSSKPLKGFGFSLSKAFDMDGNNYPDLLIGSPLSDSAVVLRSKPIGSLKVDLKFDVISIDVNRKNCKNINSKDLVPCFNLTYCMILRGNYLNGYHTINLILDIDTLLRPDETPRAYFIQNNSKFRSFSKRITISSHREFCENPIQLMINKDVRDKLTPMEVTLNYSLYDESIDFCSTCPHLIGSQIKDQITFETGCGPDGICTSDVSLSIKLVDELGSLQSVIEGFHDSVKLIVSLYNYGENAHSSKLELIVEPPLKTQINSYDIFNDTTLIINRDVGNPLGPGSNEFLIPFNLKSSIIYDQQRINFTCIFTTRSDLRSTVNGSIKQSLSIPIERVASLTIDGIISDPIFFEHPETRSVKHKKFALLFLIRKSNYSSIRSPRVTFSLPVSSSGSDFIYEPKFEVHDLTPISCKPLGLEHSPNDENEYPPSESSATSEALKSSDQISLARQKRDNLRNENKILDSQINLDCSTTKCKEIECKLGNIGTGEKGLTIKMIVAVNLEKLEKSFGSNVKVFNYSVEAKTAFFDQMVKGNNQWSKLTNSDIQLKQLPYKEAVALWIIISCSFTGLLFLLLIIIALIKVGFFKRKKREQIEVLKQRYSMAINPNLLKELGLSLHDDDEDDDSQDDESNQSTELNKEN